MEMNPYKRLLTVFPHFLAMKQDRRSCAEKVCASCDPFILAIGFTYGRFFVRFHPLME